MNHPTFNYPKNLPNSNRDEREVWNYMGSGTDEGRCFSCGLHDPDDIENGRFEE